MRPIRKSWFWLLGWAERSLGEWWMTVFVVVFWIVFPIFFFLPAFLNPQTTLGSKIWLFGVAGLGISFSCLNHIALQKKREKSSARAEVIFEPDFPIPEEKEENPRKERVTKRRKIRKAGKAREGPETLSDDDLPIRDKPLASLALHPDDIAFLDQATEFGSKGPKSPDG